ncbi:MAG: hypothetical protein ABR875_00450 [Minisyncoccia bacterium]
MLKLMTDNKIQDATIVVRWCIDRADLDLLKSQKAQRVFVLLVVISSWFEERRFLVPFEQMEEFIQLREPGTNKIYASIVWNDGGADPWARYIRRRDDRYPTDLFDRTTGVKVFDPMLPYFGKAELTVEVPDALFAKRPPRWEWRWVNFWFESKPKDQCQFRRRRIFPAYTVQPPLVLLWIIWKIFWRWLTVLVLLATGFWFNAIDVGSAEHFFLPPKRWRPVLRFQPLFHPFNDCFRDLFSNNFKEAPREMGPLFILISIYGLALAVFVGAIVVAIRWLIRNIIKFWKRMEITKPRAVPILSEEARKAVADKKAVQLARQKMLAEKKTAQLDRQYADMRILLCENVPLAEPKKTAPFRARVHLYYHDLKRAVCKPFAG